MYSLFQAFYTLAFFFGKVDRTFTADLFIASMCGFCGAMYVAPDGETEVRIGFGSLAKAKSLALRLEAAGLADWLQRAKTLELQSELKRLYKEIQDSPSWAHSQGFHKMYKVIHSELQDRYGEEESVIELA